jgi:hypothetical protein
MDDLTKLLDRFNKLYFLKKTFEAKADELGEELNEMQPTIENLMIEAGLQKLSFTNGITSSLESMTWPKIKDKVKAVKVLKKMKLNHLLLNERVNHQGLGAYIRELERKQEPLPKEWKGVIEANPVTKIQPRRPK